jgi:hypothetical protein
MNRMRGRIQMLPEEEQGQTIAKPNPSWDKSPSRAFYLECCKLILNAISAQAIEERTVNDIISLDNFHRSILHNMKSDMEEEGDRVIVWNTEPTRLGRYLGDTVILGDRLLNLPNFQNIQQPQQEARVTSCFYYHRLDYLSTEQITELHQRYTRCNFGKIFTSEYGDANNLVLLYFRLILNSFDAIARNPPALGRKYKTILQAILSGDLLTDYVSGEHYKFEVFFTRPGDLTNFKKNFKKKKWMFEIKNWYTHNIESKWGNVGKVGQIAIKKIDAWDSMIKGLENNPKQRLNTERTEGMTTLWDDTSQNAKDQIESIDSDWTYATNLFDFGVMTRELVTKLVLLKEKWLWAKVLKCFPNGDFNQLMENRLDMDKNQLIGYLERYNCYGGTSTEQSLLFSTKSN